MKTNSTFFYLFCLLVVSISGLVLTSYITPGNANGSVFAGHQPALSGMHNRMPAGYASEVAVKIDSIVNITATTADCKYNVRVYITGDDRIRITETGASVMKVPMTKGSTSPTIKFIGRGTTGDNYKTKLTGLLPHTKYYVTAYATSSQGTVNSTKQIFETK